MLYVSDFSVENEMKRKHPSNCGHVSLRFEDYAGDKAFVIQWTLVFFPAVTFVLRCDVVVVDKDFLVVAVNNAAHVRHAAVTHFHVVLVKDGVEIVVW